MNRIQSKAGKSTFLVLATLGILLICTSVVRAQIPPNLPSGFKTGNAKLIAGSFFDKVEMVVLDKESVCSKEQGEMILSDFFAKNRPTDFKITHQGGADSLYGIGKLQSPTGNFRVY
ncbi:MAG: DUF4783 domain-containing protein, partial [Marinilabiliales bacterium]|nr:DUF4783 domain-containing protein [Marinilabiliales bacterium]